VIEINLQSEKSDLRTALAKARDEYLQNKAALDGSPRGVYLRNRIEHAFCAGWNAAEAHFRAESEKSSATPDAVTR